MQLAIAIRASRDFQDQARVLCNGNVHSQSGVIGAMRAVPV
jgi:hypothetical protein